MNLSTNHESERDEEEPIRSELEKNLEILRNVDVFSGIPLEKLRIYAYLSKRVCYREGDFVFHKGEHDERGYIIVSGKAQIVREDGGESVPLEQLGEGDFFGGLALLADIKRLFSARTVTHVECLTLDRLTFQKLLLQFPAIAIKVLDVMVKRIARMEEKFLDSPR